MRRKAQEARDARAEADRIARLRAQEDEQALRDQEHQDLTRRTAAAREDPLANDPTRFLRRMTGRQPVDSKKDPR